ncbi:hypothetical protein FRC02_011162 [Tulasnella sp. 418]|nr:hypothetical protein FRC02_011162 [Tulasnella sp. 418]
MRTVGLITDYIGFTNGLNIGGIMEKSIRLIGYGQAPVHLYWNHIMNDYLMTGKYHTKL